MKKNKEAGESRVEEILPDPGIKSDLKEVLVSLLVMAVLLFVILHYCGQRVSVDGPSMNDTLQDGDQLIGDKFTYNFIRDPKRYEIVVFKLKDDPKTHYIKRLIGLPGETVQIIDNTIYINGEAIDDPYANTDLFDSGIAKEPITLGEDEYFVMGDNRNNSKDSRNPVLGPIKKDQLMGRALCRFWPLNKMCSLKVD